MASIRSFVDRRPLEMIAPFGCRNYAKSVPGVGRTNDGQSSRRLLWIYAAALVGRICPRNSPHRQPAGGGFGIGKTDRSGSTIWRALFAELNYASN